MSIGKSAWRGLKRLDRLTGKLRDKAAKAASGWVKSHLRRGKKVKGYARGGGAGAGPTPKAPAKRKAPAKAPAAAGAKRKAPAKTPAKKAPTRRPAPRPVAPDPLRSWQQARNDAEWRHARERPWWIGRDGDDIEFPGT